MEIRERRMYSCFYTGSLNHRAISSFPGQPEPGFPLYSKVLQIKHQDYTFEHKAHKTFDSHKNLEPHPTKITVVDLKSHQANHPEAQERPNLMVAVPSTPYMCSSRYSQAKMPQRSTKINQDLQTRVAVMYCRERTLPRDE